MGRYLLFLVLAAVVGGGLLTLSMRGTLSGSLQQHAETQADVLAREIAEAGQSVALSEMVGGGAFRDPTVRLGDSQGYEGGQFQIEYIPGAGGTEATLRVTGSHGGAMHTIESTYAIEPLDAPGPLWLDVPYATASAVGGAQIAGNGHNVQFDRRKHDDLELDGLLPLDELGDDIGDAMSAANASLNIPEADDWAGTGGLLDGLNVDDAEGLYQKALGALDVDGGDVRYDGDWTVGVPAAMASGRGATFGGGPLASVPMLGARVASFAFAPAAMLPASAASGGTLPDATFGTAADGTQITLFDGDLTVAGSLSGHGVLLVGGALNVLPGASLTWNGIVIVHGTDAVLPIDLDGVVDVTGMMVVVHEAFPPGGHLDVSVYRAQAGMTPAVPKGDVSEQQYPWTTQPGFPFHQHMHAFDITPAAAPRGDRVFYTESGVGRHESVVQFKEFLSRFGATPVYLTFGNPQNDGHSRFRLDVAGVDGTEGMLKRSVQAGFGRFAAADNDLRTKTFPANALRAFDVDVMSLRALKKGFDDPACAEWPICIGEDWNRRGALAVRVHRASDDARLYESTLYWHMRTDEIATHEAEEEAWRTKIRNGEAFGAHLSFGPDVTLTFDIREVAELSERLNFDGTQVVLVSSSTSHKTAAEMRATPAPPDNVTICHKPGKPNAKTKTIATADLPSHIGHGDYLGTCAVPPPAPSPGATVTICLLGAEIQVNASALDGYLALGATVGSCSGDSGDSGDS